MWQVVIIKELFNVEHLPFTFIIVSGMFSDVTALRLRKDAITLLVLMTTWSALQATSTHVSGLVSAFFLSHIDQRIKGHMGFRLLVQNTSTCELWRIKPLTFRLADNYSMFLTTAALERCSMLQLGYDYNNIKTRSHKLQYNNNKRLSENKIYKMQYNTKRYEAIYSKIWK